MKPAGGWILVEPMPLKQRLVNEYNVNNRDPYCINAKCVYDSKYFNAGDIVQFKEALQRGVAANNNYFTGIELGLPEAEYWLIEEAPNSIGGIYGYYPAYLYQDVKTADKLHAMPNIVKDFVLCEGFNLVKLIENKRKTKDKIEKIRAERSKSMLLNASGKNIFSPALNKVDTSNIVVYQRGGQVMKGPLKGEAVFLDRYVDALVVIGDNKYCIVQSADIVATIA